MAATSFRDHLRHRGLRGGTRIIVPCLGEHRAFSMLAYVWRRTRDAETSASAPGQTLHFRWPPSASVGIGGCVSVI